MTSRRLAFNHMRRSGPIHVPTRPVKTSAAVQLMPVPALEASPDSLFDAALVAGRRERTVSAAAIEAQGGLSVDELAELMEAFGLPGPAPDDPAFTPQEAHVLVQLRELDELWPAEVRRQVARAYGAMLSGIARAELQAFQMHTEPRVREQGGDAAEQVRAVQSALERLLPLADPLLLGVHGRWIEHELAQWAISAAERHSSGAELPGAVEVTFLFCDLKDFTAYAEQWGDHAAMNAVDCFFDVIAHERGDHGRFVKSLGDGAMLVYDDPGEAVAAGARVIAAMRDTQFPAVHASVHRGVAIARSGDYFGGSVNLAARLLAFAERDQLLATETVVRSSAQEFEWEPAGERVLRGVSIPLTLYRLTSRRAGTWLT